MTKPRLFEVRRTFHAVSDLRSSVWNIDAALNTTVWYMDVVTGTVEYRRNYEPEGYVKGLLTCYLDGIVTPLPVFDEKLAKVLPKWTRDMILAAVEGRPGHGPSEPPTAP
jgi:hypothetical protein